MSDKLPSRFQIGDAVHVRAKVVGVEFTEGKVHYNIVTATEEGRGITWMHVDSCDCVLPGDLEP